MRVLQAQETWTLKGMNTVCSIIYTYDKIFLKLYLHTHFRIKVWYSMFNGAVWKRKNIHKHVKIYKIWNIQSYKWKGHKTIYVLFRSIFRFLYHLRMIIFLALLLHHRRTNLFCLKFSLLHKNFDANMETACFFMLWYHACNKNTKSEWGPA
jgi:hypothetical protein